VIDIFAFARVLGTIAPCGCTTESLGGLQYAFGFIEANSQASTRLVLEPGSFLFPDPAGAGGAADAAAWGQAEQRAAALQMPLCRAWGAAGLGARTDGPQLAEVGAGAGDVADAAGAGEQPQARCARGAGRIGSCDSAMRRGDRRGVTAVIDPGLAPSLKAEAPAERCGGRSRRCARRAPT
jgi:hypothetical protein